MSEYEHGFHPCGSARELAARCQMWIEDLSELDLSREQLPTVILVWKWLQREVGKWAPRAESVVCLPECSPSRIIEKLEAVRRLAEC